MEKERGLFRLRGDRYSSRLQCWVERGKLEEVVHAYNPGGSSTASNTLRGGTIGKEGGWAGKEAG